MADKEKQIILTTRDLVLLFIFFIVVLMIVFSIGLLVGKNFPSEGAEMAQLDSDPNQLDNAATPARSQSAENRENASPRRSPVTETDLDSRKTVSMPADVKSPQVGSEEQLQTTPPAQAETSTERTQRQNAAPPKSVPAAPPKPTPTPGAGETLYSVQAYASPDYEAAKLKVAELKNKGYDAFVKVPDTGSGDTYYRVQVGTFRSRINAQSRVNRLKQDGYKDAFIRKVVE